LLTIVLDVLLVFFCSFLSSVIPYIKSNSTNEVISFATVKVHLHVPTCLDQLCSQPLWQACFGGRTAISSTQRRSRQSNG